MSLKSMIMFMNMIANIISCYRRWTSSKNNSDRDICGDKLI